MISQKRLCLISTSILVPAMLVATACSNAQTPQSGSKERKLSDLAKPPASISEEAEPCDIKGWSIDQDPNGLNVRAEPGFKAEILGKLLPAGDAESGHDHGGDDSKRAGPEQIYYGPEFTIIGIEGDWLKIDKIEPITEGINPKTGDEWIRKNFQGTGWVHWSKVQPRLGGVPSDDPAEHAYAEPSFESKKTLNIANTNLFGMDHIWTDVPRILECSGKWGKIEFTQYGENNPKTRIWTRYPKNKQKKIQGWMNAG